MSTLEISCDLTPAGKHPLGITVAVNDHVYFSTDRLLDKTTVKITLPDAPADYTLAWTMSGKTSEHTTIDHQGNILADNVIFVDNLKFDDIELGHTFNKLAVYRHDFNGTQAMTDCKFFGAMGCNGTVELKFSTPVQHWFLEYM